MSTPTVNFGYASALRREIIARNRKIAESKGFASACSHGPGEVVVYVAGEDGETHGNFLPQSYAAIMANPAWRRRLGKVHTGRRNLPKGNSWRELDSCTSSDALLMNIFCHPKALSEARLQRLMGIDLIATPTFGVRVAAPLTNGHRDRTEVDMRFGDVLVEAKLTEADFQTCALESVARYADFGELFNHSALSRAESIRGYQLIRGVLAARASNARFCVIADARRPDLREQWFTVMQSVRGYELRMRCQMLTWQEIAAVLPDNLQQWLGEKYGIFAPGREPQLDAADWYW
jgi:hypothetical protein